MTSDALLALIGMVLVVCASAAIIAVALARQRVAAQRDAEALARLLSAHLAAWRRYCEADDDSFDAIAPESTLLKQACDLQARRFPDLHARLRMVVLLHGMMTRALIAADSCASRVATLRTLIGQMEWECDLAMQELRWPLDESPTRTARSPVAPLRAPAPASAYGSPSSAGVRTTRG